MPRWWTWLFGGPVQARTARATVPATVLDAADEFLRPCLDDCRLPDLAASGRARALLDRALTVRQRGDLVSNGYFYVSGRKFVYRIREGHAGNVDALDSSGRVVNRYCGHPQGRLPVYDVMLAQKLWIETDEDMFLKRAAPYPPRY